MQERQEEIWSSPPLAGTDGKWLKYMLWSSVNSRTGQVSHRLEIRLFGPLGTYDAQTGPYKDHVTFPLALWPHLVKAAAECAQALRGRGLLPEPEEQPFKGGYLSRNLLVTSPKVSDSSIRFLLEEQRENDGPAPRSRHKVLLVVSGPDACGNTIDLNKLELPLGAFLAFSEHISEVQWLLQQRGLIQPSE